MAQSQINEVDVVLVGAGIMSATLGVLLNQLDGSKRIAILEALSQGAQESSNAWNNAGTGHAGLCELNYTPADAQGEIDPQKAIHINCQFEVSKQFWASMTERGVLTNPKDFINSIPHLSYVGSTNSAYLKKRYETLKQHHCFESMELSEERVVLDQWIPLMMEGRDSQEKLTATRVKNGTDVNFGALAQGLLTYLAKQPQVALHFDHKVVGIERQGEQWLVKSFDKKTGETLVFKSKFVFLGAGGSALTLLQKTGIPESKGYGGFPVSGQWLRCDNAEVVNKHSAKVYSLAEVGAPPMSVPHLDTRIIDGQKSLLFGPYAGFTTKFLKKGSFFDVLKSVRPDNLGAMLAVGRDNKDLTQYLIKQVMQTMDDRRNALRLFYPNARPEDWRLEVAGQRVQIIKKDSACGGKLEFGTEIVASADGSLAALLGASPGASVSVSAMLNVLDRCFAKQSHTPDWQKTRSDLIKANVDELIKNADLYREIQSQSNKHLGLTRLNTQT